MNRLTLVSAAFVASLASLQSARAVLISGDFVRTQSGVTTAPVSGDTAATGTLKNAVGYQFTGQVGTWNGLNLGNNNTSPMSFTSGLLNDGNGNPTTVQFRILNSGVPNPNNPANILPGYRVGSSTVNTTAPHLRYEYASIHTGAGTQLYMNWLITGLPPTRSTISSFSVRLTMPPLSPPTIIRSRR